MKTLTTMICLFSLMYLGVGHLKAQSPTEIKLGHGAEVSIPVYMDYSPINNVTAARITVTWDADHFYFVRVEQADQWGDRGYLIIENKNDTTNGVYRVAYAGVSPLLGDSLMLTLTLRTKEVSASGQVEARGLFNEATTEFLTTQPYEIDQSLPVELVWFLARVDSDSVLVSWKTASEFNSALFRVEALEMVWSHGEWKTSPAIYLKTIKAAGTTPHGALYEFRTALSPGMYRFQLQQIDFDGTFKTYRTEMYEVGMDAPRLDVYPNPANPSITLQVVAPNYERTTIHIYDLLGRMRTVVADEGMVGARSINVPLGALPSGMYFVVMRRNGATLARKFTILR